MKEHCIKMIKGMHETEGYTYERVRNALGVTATNVAEAIGVSRNKLRKFEQGENITHAGLLRYALQQFYKKICQYMNVDLYALVDDVMQGWAVMESCVKALESVLGYEDRTEDDYNFERFMSISDALNRAKKINLSLYRLQNAIHESANIVQAKHMMLDSYAQAA